MAHLVNITRYDYNPGGHRYKPPWVGAYDVSNKYQLIFKYAMHMIHTEKTTTVS